MTINPLDIITPLRESHSKMVDIFTKGSCWNLFVILRRIFPGARAFYNGDHVITFYRGKYYDISGEVTYKGYYPLNDKKAISQMSRYELKLKQDES